MLMKTVWPWPGINQKKMAATRSTVMLSKLRRRGQTSGNQSTKSYLAKIQNSQVSHNTLKIGQSWHLNFVLNCQEHSHSTRVVNVLFVQYQHWIWYKSGFSWQAWKSEILLSERSCNKLNIFWSKHKARDGSLMNGFGVQFAETFERCNKSIWTYYQFIILIIISSCCFSLYGTLYLWLINNIVIRSSWLGQRPWIWIPCKSQESRWPRRSKSTIGFCCCQTKTKCVVSRFSFSYMNITNLYIVIFSYLLTYVYFYTIKIQ